MNRNKAGIRVILKDTRMEIEHLGQKAAKATTRCEADLKELLETLRQIDASWSGSCLGYHSRMYYRNFQNPPPEQRFSIEWGAIREIAEGWNEKIYDDIEAFLRKKHKDIDIDRIREILGGLLKEARDLQSRVFSNLSFLRDMKGFDIETESLEKIRKQQLYVSVDKWDNDAIPKIMMTRDTEASAGGPQIPPHIRYQSQVRYLMSIPLCTEEFVKTSKELIRQVETRLLVAEEPHPFDAIDKVILVCERFHLVAKQIKQRYDKRTPFTITDEHDVQDLLHAILHLHFDDIRVEEWTPSYAGSSSRMDFLLKDEKIVLESKYNLPGKEVGNQLLEDIARYGKYPDCRTLVCFVYDPEGIVKNPRGLEHDLESQSKKDLKIIVMIRPR